MMRKTTIQIIILVLIFLACLIIWYFSSEFRKQHFLAQRGHADAQYFLGHSYDQGTNGITQNTCQANQWWLKAAQQNYKPAQIALGNRYIQQPSDQVECISLPVKDIQNYVLLATEDGNYHGYYTLAEYYAKETAEKIQYLEITLLKLQEQFIVT